MESCNPVFLPGLARPGHRIQSGWEDERVWKLRSLLVRKTNTIWLVVWLPFFIFPYIGNVIIPIDFHIFQRGGWTTNQLWTIVDYLYFIKLLLLHHSGISSLGCETPDDFHQKNNTHRIKPRGDCTTFMGYIHGIFSWDSWPKSR